MIFVTGDIHGEHSITKLGSGNFPLGKTLTRDDYVIICGDFGLLWDDSAQEHYWRKWLEEKPWTTLWIDGNHENFDMLSGFPTEDWHGGKVQRISEHVLHLCRGHVFRIDGKTFFAFGGAESHDKQYRRMGISMWEAELPSAEEMEAGRRALDAVGWKVDYVLSHSLPQRIQDMLFPLEDYWDNPLTRFFDEIDRKLTFDTWFTGHYHRSRLFENYYLLYHNIIALEEEGFAQASIRADDLRW